MSVKDWKMSLGVVTAEVVGDFDKRCGVIRLEARSQSLEGDVGGEETVTEHADNVSEMFDCKQKGKRDSDDYKTDLCVYDEEMD